MKRKIFVTAFFGVMIPIGTHFAIGLAAAGDRVAVAMFDYWVDGLVRTAAASINYGPIEGNDNNLTNEDIMREEAARIGIDPDFGLAILKVESAHKQLAQSPKGALGLMQVMPANAKSCGLSVDDLLRRRPNIRCGLSIFHTALKTHRDVVAALYDYNGGPKCVKNRCAESVEYARNVLMTAAKDQG